MELIWRRICVYDIEILGLWATTHCFLCSNCSAHVINYIASFVQTVQPLQLTYYILCSKCSAHAIHYNASFVQTVQPLQYTSLLPLFKLFSPSNILHYFLYSDCSAHATYFIASFVETERSLQLTYYSFFPLIIFFIWIYMLVSLEYFQIREFRKIEGFIVVNNYSFRRWHIWTRGVKVLKDLLLQLLQNTIVSDLYNSTAL